MKTLTEFSGTMIRMAAKAEAEARKKIPKEVLAVKAAPGPAEGVTAKPNENADASALPAEGPDSVTDAADQALAEQAAGGSDVEGAGEREAKPGEAGTADDEMQPGAVEEEQREEAVAGQDLAGSGDAQKATEGGAKPSEVNADEEGPLGAEPTEETSAVKEILDKAVAEATGMSGDRLVRLREALEAAGRQVERVRLVRVFGSEEEVSGAMKIGEFQYVVDLMPQSMKQNFERDERDKRRGPRRPSGKGKDSASLEGGFSMESLMQDRRSERQGGGGGRGGGKPGGGRGRPGGGRGPKPGGAPPKS